MNRKLTLILIVLAWFFGIYATLQNMYVSLDLHKASYTYLGTAIWMIFFMAFIKDIDKTIKNGINFLLGSFYFFSLILVLISFYSSPTNEPDFFAGAIFFIAGSLALGASFFLKVKKEVKVEKIGLFHRVFRYFLIFISLIYFVVPMLNRIVSVKSFEQKNMADKVVNIELESCPPERE